MRLDNYLLICLIAALGLGAIMKNLAVLTLAVCLSGCATNYTYVPIVPNPRQIEMAEAQCQMMSTSAQQGMFAMGSPSYVAGAQIGNAIGNAIRVDQFMQQCMTLQGWKRVSVQQKTTAAMPVANQSHSPITGKPMKGGGDFPPAPR